LPAHTQYNQAVYTRIIASVDEKKNGEAAAAAGSIKPWLPRHSASSYMYSVQLTSLYILINENKYIEAYIIIIRGDDVNFTV
jgi:hypothetical protein